MKQLHIRVEEDLYKFIKNESKSQNITIKQYIINDLTRNIRQAEENDSMFSNKEIEKFRFIDLFAGIGGMRIPFENMGGKCVFSSEWNKYSQITYDANFKEMPHGDITQIDAECIPNHDLLIAGFPCQPFSLAGVSKKNSLGRAHGFLDETQGTLFFDVARIISKKRPKVFLLENVKNLKTHDKGKTFEVIKSTLEGLNYTVFHDIIDAANYVPQHRERIYIVGFDNDIFGDNIKFKFPEPINENVPVLKDILEENADPKYTLSDKLWQYLQDYAKKHKEKGNGFGFGLVDVNGQSRTLSARYHKDGSEILIPQSGRNPRRLTPKECAKLMGYPDTFQIVVSDTQAYRQFGNSVAVPVIEALAKRIISTIESFHEINGEVAWEMCSKEISAVK
jgi:DNA (cytosine-5)-methyltransferase 1